MKHINILLFAIILSLSSCLGDMDTLKLGSTSTLPEESWKEEATYEQYLAKLYASFAVSGNQGPDGYNDISASDQGEATFARSYFTLQEFCTDEVRVAWKSNTLDDIQFLRWGSNNNFVKLMYNRLFMSIAFCNEYLRETTDDKVSKRGISQEMKLKIIGYREEAKVLRAMNYYFLLDFFGNVPLILEADGVGAYLPQQITRKELYDWLITELNSIEQLPDATQYGRVNKNVVSMLLSKIYLNAQIYIGESKYTECLTELNKILSAQYSLEPTYKHLFGADNHLSPEIIFPIVYDGKKLTTWGGMTFIIGFEAVGDMNSAETFGLNQVWSGGRVDKNFHSLFGASDNRALFWKTNRTSEITDLYNVKQGWSVVKYTNLDRYGNPGSDNQFPDTDFPLWRLGDVYLMYAEAVLRGGQGGQMSQALTYVNMLQERSNTQKQITQSDLTLDFLRAERSRELYWEGHRRTDLIRFDSFTQNYSWSWKGGTISGVQNVDSKYNIYPLPADELSVNVNLKQNTGY